MATIGLNFFLEGFGEMVWGANVKKLDIGIPDRSFIVRGVQINELELTAAVTAAVLVAVLALFFQRTRIGRALRAVADDHEAALSLGDRKSTRLNSSHRCISYAVFCLKKK